jgi:hypothetical protein
LYDRSYNQYGAQSSQHDAKEAVSLIWTSDQGTNGREEFRSNWLGLPARRRTLSIMEAADAIPAFTRRPFQIDRGVPASAVNPNYEMVVRLPTDEDPAEVPVGLVSRQYQLIQHHEILQRGRRLWRRSALT